MIENNIIKIVPDYFGATDFYNEVIPFFMKVKSYDAQRKQRMAY